MTNKSPNPEVNFMKGTYSIDEGTEDDGSANSEDLDEKM